MIVVVFIYGFGGFLANWAGLITPETNPNLYFFQLFDSEGYGGGMLHNWAGVC